MIRRIGCLSAQALPSEIDVGSLAEPPATRKLFSPVKQWFH